MSEITPENTTDQQFLDARDLLRTSIGSLMPDLDFGNGTALNDLIITPAAKLAAAEFQREAQVYASYDLASVNDTTDIDIINGILGRYFIDPSAGAKATGFIKVITDSTSTLIIPRSVPLVTLSGLAFVTDGDIRVFETAEQRAAASDLLFIPQGDLFYFLVPVTAQNTGDSYNITADTPFEIPSGFNTVTAMYANSDFLGGSSTETPADAVKRLPTSFGAQTTGMVSSIKKLINEQFGISDVSAVTSNNAAMVRSARNPVGLPVGGFCDLYVRSNVRANVETETLEAVLVDPVTGRWRITLDNAYAGTYSVSISPVASSGVLTIVNKVVGIEFEDANNHPTVVSADDATFSSVQTLLIEFIDDFESATGLTAGDTRNYNVSITSMPNILDISNYLAQPDVGSPGVDLLVRAVTPARLGVSMKIMHNVADKEVDQATIKTAIVTAVYDLGIGRKYIDGTTIIGVVQSKLGTRSYVHTESFAVEARILDHKLAESVVVGAKYIDIVERPEDGVTKDTIGFTIREEDINIIVEEYA